MCFAPLLAPHQESTKTQMCNPFRVCLRVQEESSIYSYNPDLQSDPFGADGGLWSFNYFWYNKKLKRVLFFRGRAVSYAAPMLDDEAYLPDDIFFHDDDYDME